MPVKLETTINREVSRAAGDRPTFNLPVNPVSFCMLTLRALAGASAPTLANLLSVIDTIEVLFKGTSIYNMSMANAYRYVRALWGREIDIENFSRVSPALVRWSIPIPFGRAPYMMDECFPASRAGELQCRLTYASSFTNLSAVIENFATVELLDADPTRFLKATTIHDQSAAIGDQYEIRLPIGNPILGILLFGTTFIDTAATSTIRRIKLLLDNVEYGTSLIESDALRAMSYLRMGNPMTYSQNQSEFSQFYFMDFDPLKDGAFAIPTEGRADVKLQVRADAADAIRAIPIELIQLAGAGA